MSEGWVIAQAHCYGCGQMFSFDPDRVASVWVDPVTRRPPDVDEHGHRQPVDRAALDRAVRAPICPECIALVHTLRADGGG
jgi:hypothetical protein